MPVALEGGGGGVGRGMWRVSGVGDKVWPSDTVLALLQFHNLCICLMWLPVFVLLLTVETFFKSSRSRV